MGRKKWGQTTKILFIFGCFVATCTLYLALSPIQESRKSCDCSKDAKQARGIAARKLDASHNDTTKPNDTGLSPETSTAGWQKLLHKHDDPSWGRDRLAILVPFRDRFEELMDFVPYMHEYLNMKKVRHKIFVINQVDVLRFNRGSLINIGYIVSRLECDYIAMHDVDLIPMNLHISYAKPVNGPYHASAPDLHPRYHYPTFVGGILLLTNEHFSKVNGFSNRYFGWGKEDDEFYVRMKAAGLVIQQPVNITTGFNTFKHIHDKVMRPRDNKRYFDQKVKSRIRDRITGIDTVTYEITGRYDMEILNAPATVINVALRCDLNDTPWCINLELYYALQDYAENKDKLFPKDVYTKATNGSYVKTGVVYEKKNPPVDLNHFLNLDLNGPLSYVDQKKEDDPVPK